jgi:hypothetical protein
MCSSFVINIAHSVVLRVSLRVQRGFLRHQIGYQFFGPVNRDLIAYRALYPAIPLDVLVDLYALLAHGQFRIRAWVTEHPPLF